MNYLLCSLYLCVPDEVAAPLKLTRQGRIDAAKAPAGGAGKKAKKGGLLDLMVDPVDICALLPKDWCHFSSHFSFRVLYIA